MGFQEYVNVNVRVKPSSRRQSINNSLQIVSRNPAIIFSVDKQQTFNFDEIFSEESSQEDIYNVSVKPLVQKVKEGFNCTIFAYGQTGTGKTYTMGTNPKEPNPGIISYALKDFFSNDDLEEYDVRVSFMEIYNEKVYDLLRNTDKVPLPVRGLRVEGLSVERVFNLNEANHFLEMGSRNRHTGETKQNMCSSRSHAIFSIHFTVNHREGQTAAKLNLVDLAGSESVKKAGTQGSTFQEGININKGLLCIGQVMTALSANLSYIPYRQSVITTILQDSLSRNNYISLIACVKAETEDSTESIQTLEFAQRVKMIKNKPEINEVVMKYKTNHPVLFERKISCTPMKRPPKTPFKPQLFKKPRNVNNLSNISVPSSVSLECSKSVSSLSSNMESLSFSPIIKKYFSQMETTLVDKFQTVIQNTLKRPTRRSTRISGYANKENTPKYSWNQIQKKVSKLVQDELIQLTTKSSRAASSPLDHSDKNTAKRVLDYGSPKFEEPPCVSPIDSSYFDVINISQYDNKRNSTTNVEDLSGNEMSRGNLKRPKHNSEKSSDFSFKVPTIPNRITPPIRKEAPRRSMRICNRRESSVNEPENSLLIPDESTRSNEKVATRRSTRISMRKGGFINEPENIKNTQYYENKSVREKWTVNACKCNQVNSKLTVHKKPISKSMKNQSPRKVQIKEVLRILNDGDLKQLQKLSTVGQKTAGRIMLYRQFKGPFKSVEELEDMPGWTNTLFKNFLKQNFLDI